MPYCPTCKQAFPESATECPDCKAALVDELPYQAVPGEGETWVEITSVGTDDEARLVQGFLQAEGIPAQIENVKFTAEPVNFGKMGDIRVYVPSQEEKHALELLRQREVAYENLDDDTETIVTDEGVTDIDENAVAEPE